MIVLDTHALIWWVSDDQRLSLKARKAIEDEMNDDDAHIVVSSISTWEIAMLISKGRLALTMDIDEWIATVADIPRVQFTPLDNNVAIQSVRLPGEFHADPADRMITALARHLSAPLVTDDEKIRAYKHVNTVW